MKFIEKIEKKKETWFILYTIILFFLLRLPSLIEPYWYGDEAIYEVIGMALNKGRMLYSQIWDNKPPLIYLIYAFAHADQFTIRLFSLVSAVSSAIIFYYLSLRLFRSYKISTVCTVFYIILFATPILEGNIANAENFMLLPIIAASLLVYKISEAKKTNQAQIKPQVTLFFAGLLLSVAFLFKIVAIFDFAAFLIFLTFLYLPEKFVSPKGKLLILENKRLYKDLLKNLMIYATGFLIPIALTVLYFLIQGSFIDFMQAAFLNNISYIGYKNKFIISQGFLLLKLLALFSVIGLLFWKRKIIPQSIMFILIWFFFSVFNAFFSGRVWTHYLLVLLPSTVLVLGLLFERKAKKIRIIILGLLIILIYFVNVFFKISISSIEKTFQYYQNYALFITNKKSIKEYQKYFDRRVPRDYEVARLIVNKLKPDDSVFIWGNNPQIYVLSNTLPPGKYAVEYHISQSSKAVEETENDLKMIKPKYLIILSEMTHIPFSIEAYINKYYLEGAIIYERIL